MLYSVQDHWLRWCYNCHLSAFAVCLVVGRRFVLRPVVPDHLVGNAVPCEVSLHLLDDRHRIGIVKLVYFPEVAVVINDNKIACVTDAGQISVDHSPASVRDIMRHQRISLLNGLMSVSYRA